jgi:hypothetical protein
MSRVTKLSLNSQKVSEVKKTLMMIEIFVKEVNEVADIICCLYSLKLFLQAHILWGLHKCKNFLSSLLIDLDNLHGEHLINFRPVWVWLNKKVLSGRTDLELVLHPLHHLDSSFHFLACTLVLFGQVVTSSVFPLFFLLFIKTQCAICLS